MKLNNLTKLSNIK